MSQEGGNWNRVAISMRDFGFPKPLPTTPMIRQEPGEIVGSIEKGLTAPGSYFWTAWIGSISFLRMTRIDRIASSLAAMG